MSTSPLKTLKLVLPLLRKANKPFAVAGGIAASFYRLQPRLTADLDLAIDAGSQEASVKIGEKIIKQMGLKVFSGFIEGGAKIFKGHTALLSGRDAQSGDLNSTLDILMPAFPWVSSAVERAQSHLIDFGFAKVPTITAEDLLIAKCFAVSLSSKRFQDLDDLQQIFRASKQLDLAYIGSKLDEFGLSFPKELAADVPSSLRRRGRSSIRVLSET